MGSPISPVLADHVIEVTEESVITIAISPLKWCFNVISCVLLISCTPFPLWSKYFTKVQISVLREILAFALTVKNLNSSYWIWYSSLTMSSLVFETIVIRIHVAMCQFYDSFFCRISLRESGFFFWWSLLLRFYLEIEHWKGA